MPSRRATLGAVGAAGVALLAGCSAGGDLGATDEGGSGGGGETATPTPTSTVTLTGEPATFDAYLRGPETDRLLFDETDVETVGAVQSTRGPYGVPITLSEEAVAVVETIFEAAGVDDSPGRYAIALELDAEAVGEYGISPELAEAVAGGEWGGQFFLNAKNEATARRLRRALVEG